MQAKPYRIVAMLVMSCLVGACMALRQGVCPDCEIQPPGKSTGLATTAEPFICIPTAAGNNEATCQPFAGQLRQTAAGAAAAQCVRDHNVQCIQRNCPNPCLPSAAIAKASLVLDANYKGCPNPKGQDACRLLAVIADCTCFCPQVVE